MRRVPLGLWGLAVLSGVLQVLPFPIAGPVPLWRTHICWVALTPLLWALVGNADDGRPIHRLQGAALGYVSGFVWYMGSCYWIYQTMHVYGGLAEPIAAVIVALFSLYVGLYHALFGALVATVRNSRLGRQGALLLGVAIVAGYTFALLHPRPRAREAETGAATLLQENLDVGAVEEQPLESEEQLLEKFAALSRQPAATLLSGMPEIAGTRVIERPRRLVLNATQMPPANGHDGSLVPWLGGAYERSDLVVWPESPAPFKEGEPAFREAMRTLARQMGAPVIVGNIGIGQAHDRAKLRGVDTYNSASFIRPDGSFAGRYDKMHLVPFGEYVPYKQLFFFAGSLLAEVGTFEPGVKRDVFASGGHTFGTFICYESIFGDEIREFSKMGAEVLVNISNDGWYGDTSAPWQHLNMVRMRAIESHRWVLRSTNTGITSVIDPEGRVVAAAPRHSRTAIRVPFGYEHDVTFYARHGDWLPWGCAVGTVLAVGFAEWSRRSLAA